MSMENVVGQPHNQQVCNRANSLEGGQFVKKIQKRQIKLMMGLCLQFHFAIERERHEHTL